MTENFDRQAWDALVERAVADDPILTALDMGVLEGMSTEQVDLFFRTVLGATPTDEELLEQSRIETEARMKAQFEAAVAAADNRVVRETEAGVSRLSGRHPAEQLLPSNTELRKRGGIVSAHPWTDPWADADDLSMAYTRAVRRIFTASIVTTILVVTFLIGIALGASA